MLTSRKRCGEHLAGLDDVDELMFMPGTKGRGAMLA